MTLSQKGFYGSNCVSTGSAGRLAEFHAASAMSFPIHSPEEADTRPEQGDSAEQYKPIQRNPLVATTGAYLYSFTANYLVTRTRVYRDRLSFN